MRFFRFIFSKIFLKNFALWLLISLLLIFLVFKFLNIFTLHGKSKTVPNFIGLNITDLDNLLVDQDFKFVLIDSVYDNSKEQGAIVMQDPFSNTRVKKGRKIYLTVVADLPEQVRMPNLIDLSLRQALAELRALGLKIGQLKYVEDFAENAILQQLYQGDTIKPDTLILKSSTIDLVLGKGVNYTRIRIPFLIGKTQSEAIKIIKNESFNLKDEYFLDTIENADARIYKQFPAAASDTLVKLGQAISLWYRSDEFFDFDSLIESFKPDTLALDSLMRDSLLIDSLYYEFLQTDTIDEENIIN